MRHKIDRNTSDQETLIDIRRGRVVVTGGRGFLGRALCTELRSLGTEEIIAPSSAEFDLRDPTACARLIQPDDIVIHLAATVGGIGFNREHPGRLFYDNLIMGVQLMEVARVVGVRQFVTVGTICAYPKFTPVPFKGG